jgi:hypothetical protein
MEGSDGIFVHKFSISMGGKTLFKDAKLSLAHGLNIHRKCHPCIPMCAWVKNIHILNLVNARTSEMCVHESTRTECYVIRKKRGC